MKKIITILSALFMTATLFAQSPQRMSYQAVVRNASNNLVLNTPVGMRVSILQGSVFGASVYVETQTPTTNSNGLVSLSIGSGTILAGSFSTINWANGPYFIKTETDPLGGTAYSITGSSELMSVPYALYAGNATTYTSGNGISISNGNITNTAPNQTVSIVAAGSTSVIGTYPNYTVSSPSYIAGNGITINSNTISISNPSLTIGSSYAGGIVFYIDATGQHGLVSASNDQGTNSWVPSVTWTNTAISSTFDCYLCGDVNSRIANNLFGGVSNAFQICSTYSIGGYSDWYLPSRYELTLMYLNLKTMNLGNFSNGWYWSSTEFSSQAAWVINFTNGSYAGYSKWGSPSVIVRPIRAF